KPQTAISTSAGAGNRSSTDGRWATESSTAGAATRKHPFHEILRGSEDANLRTRTNSPSWQLPCDCPSFRPGIRHVEWNCAGDPGNRRRKDDADLRLWGHETHEACRHWRSIQFGRDEHRRSPSAPGPARGG